VLLFPQTHEEIREHMHWNAKHEPKKSILVFKTTGFRIQGTQYFIFEDYQQEEM